MSRARTAFCKWLASRCVAVGGAPVDVLRCSAQCAQGTGQTWRCNVYANVHADSVACGFCWRVCVHARVQLQSPEQEGRHLPGYGRWHCCSEASSLPFVLCCQRPVFAPRHTHCAKQRRSGVGAARVCSCARSLTDSCNCMVLQSSWARARLPQVPVATVLGLQQTLDCALHRAPRTEPARSLLAWRN